MLNRIIVNVITNLIVTGSLLLFVLPDFGAQNTEARSILSRISELEAEYQALLDSVRVAQSAPTDAVIDDLYAQIELMNQRIGVTGDGSTEPFIPVENTGQPGRNQSSKSPGIVSALLDQRYMLSEDWQNVDREIKTMTKEELRGFWYEMSTAIANGNIELLDNEAERLN